jgi:hypothetical protein
MNKLQCRTKWSSICEKVWIRGLKIIRNSYEEEKRILVVNAYFLINMEGKNEEVTFWNNAFGVGNCSPYPNDGSGKYTD